MKIAENVWKVNVDSNIYFIDEDEKIIIDAGPKTHREDVISELSKFVDVNKIDKVIFTHLHYDHMGNFDLFPNARFFASEQEIKDFEENALGATVGLDPLLLSKFKKIKLEPLEDMNGLKIIPTPGHTKGSICLYYEKEKVLFTGDTKFENGMGRIDLPTSSPEEMQNSLNKIEEIDYVVLAPGHDY
jgi:hydroxyacylglutathione hydrolase